MYQQNLEIKVSESNGRNVYSVHLKSHSLPSQSLKTELINAARAIAAANPQQTALLLTDTYESAITAAAFVEAKVNFKVYLLDFPGTSHLDNFVNYLKNLGVEPKKLIFDYSNPEHFAGLESLQEKTGSFDLGSLFQIWASCQYDEPTVLPGSFVVPQFSKNGIFTKWKHLDPKEVNSHFFLKDHNGIASFFCCSSEVINSQIYQKANIYARFLPEQSLLVHAADPEFRRILADQTGFSPVLDYTEDEVSLPVYRKALSLQSRAIKERFSRLANKCNSVPKINSVESNVQDIPKTQVQIDTNDPVYLNVSKAGKRFDVSRYLISSPESRKGSEFFAAFPTLISLHQFEKDLSFVRAYAEKLEYLKNYSNYNSHTDVLSDSELSEFKMFFESCIKNYFEKMGYAYDHFEITQSWFNKSHFMESHKPHNHPNSLLSGVFYLTTGGEGNTIFKKEEYPRIFKLNTYKPTSWNAPAFEVAPKAGRLILFPSTLYHYTLAHANPGEIRYSLAFNVMPRGDIGELENGAWVQL
jgi:uncharacterized protein (TIGR02466 family)